MKAKILYNNIQYFLTKDSINTYNTYNRFFYLPLYNSINTYNSYNRFLLTAVL